MKSKDILISAVEIKNPDNVSVTTGGAPSGISDATGATGASGNLGASSVSGRLIRVAVVSDGELIDYTVSRGGDRFAAGNIYKGVVTKIIPGTQSCFINIGSDKNAVMYAKDTAPALFSGARVIRPIETVLRTGQKAVVQILREATGDKGAHVTTRLALPGKYAVLLPDSDMCTVSRKIFDTKESFRLKTIASSHMPQGCGLIMRTEAAGVSETVIAADIDALTVSLRDMYYKEAEDKIPDILHAETDFCRDIIRRAINDDIGRVICDDRRLYRELLGHATAINQEISYKIQFYREQWRLFAFHGIQNEIRSLSERQVWLKCGAYIVIDKTEALTAIDVNTGKYSGGGSPKDTILRVNTEAVIEAARQIRLRNIGGIIVIDAVRMGDTGDQRAVIAELETELSKDRVKTYVAGFTRLGLIELTRKRAGAEHGAGFGANTAGRSGGYADRYTGANAGSDSDDANAATFDMFEY